MQRNMQVSNVYATAIFVTVNMNYNDEATHQDQDVDAERQGVPVVARHHVGRAHHAGHYALNGRRAEAGVAADVRMV